MKNYKAHNSVFLILIEENWYSKQGKNLDKIDYVIDKLARHETLEPKYKDHKLINDKYYMNCRECHIEPDWLLVYQY